MSKQNPLSAFVIKHCRKFGLFRNERTTVLSKADELQVLQYCLACQNKQDHNEFEADSGSVGKLQNQINKSSSVIIEQLIDRFHNSINSSESKEGNYGKLETDVCVHDSDRQTANTFHKDAEAFNNQFEEAAGDEPTMLDVKALDVGKTEAVLGLFQNYKDTSNHCTILDAYTMFVKSLLDQKSDLYQFLIASKDMPDLDCDIDDNERMQSTVKELILRISKMTSDVTSSTDSDNSSESNRESTNITSETEAAPLLSSLGQSPKTPVSKNVSDSGQSPAESVVTTAATPKTPYTPSHRKEFQSIFVHDVFRAYLHLLVNSRSELALARMFNIPDRGLDHEAFTHLKHEAQTTGLSMYQTLSSFLLRIQLGGSGYAPSATHPLMAYVKGLSSLLDLTQKLQTVIEEVPEMSSACRRIVNVIKNNLIQSKNGKFPRSLVEPVAENIHNSLSSIIQEVEAMAGSSPERAISSGGSLLGRRCLRVIHQFLDRSAVAKSNFDHQLMSDVCFSSQTPTRFPSLLTQFRSPAIMDLEDEAEECNPDQENCKPVNHGTMKQFVSSALPVDGEAGSDLLLTQGTLNSIEVIPSKTIVHAREDNSDSTVETSRKTSNIGNRNKSKLANDISKTHPKRKGDKRCASSSIDKENLIGSPAQKVAVQGKQRKTETQRDLESSPKSSNLGSSQGNTDKSKKQGKSCRRKLLPQVKGQAKITGFFRM